MRRRIAANSARGTANLGEQAPSADLVTVRPTDDDTHRQIRAVLFDVLWTDRTRPEQAGVA